MSDIWGGLLGYQQQYGTPPVDLSGYTQDMANYRSGLKEQKYAQGIFDAAANGTGPNAGMMQAQQGAQDQANFGAANAASATGLARGNAMKMGLGQATGASQNANMLGQQLLASQQMQGAVQSLQGMLQQRASLLMAQGMDAQQAYDQAQLELQTGQLNTNIAGQNQGNIMHALGIGAQTVSGVGGAVAHA